MKILNKDKYLLTHSALECFEKLKFKIKNKKTQL